MKLLLVAYEFLPSASPQSLRWIYLANALAEAGDEVHVLAPDIPDYHSRGLPTLHPHIVLHRTFAGPFNGMLRWNQLRRGYRPAESRGISLRDEAGAVAVATKAVTEELNWKGVLWHAGLNWKGRLFESLQDIAAKVMFPDIRAEWLPWARHRLRRLLREVQPDAVITSHEPATTLSLGRFARRKGYVWVADMGDPVCAPYTPARWRRKAMRLERQVCREADLITTTTQGMVRLLQQRHAREAAVDVLTQGYDAALAPAVERPDVIGRLELLYTGSFYRFRLPDELLAAVLLNPGVRLNVASANPPEELKKLAALHPQSVRLLGYMSHLAVLALQRQADVLVNIGNELPDQVPGKVYEYFGAGKPILHLSAKGFDGAVDMLATSGRALICANQRHAIQESLAMLQNAVVIGGLDMGMDKVEQYSWQSLACRLRLSLHAVTAGRTPKPGVSVEKDIIH